MKIKWYKGFLSLLVSLSLVLSACNTGGGVANNTTPTPSVEKLKITFNASDAECKEGEEVFTSGSEIEEGKELKFTAKIMEGESIKCWYVNNNKKESETKKEFVYKVVATDADSNKVINISYASNALKLMFDATQIKCKKGYGGTGEEVASGVKVKEGEDYQFTTVGLGEDEIIDVWYAGKRKINLSPSRDPKSYTVKKTDADEKNIIQIRYEKRAIKKYTLQFDATQIKCKKGYLGSGEEVASCVKVKEGEDYQFTPLITEDEIVEFWYAGKTKISFSPSRDPRSYTVKKEDADEKNVIQIRYEKREIKKVTLKFDNNTVSCKKGYGGTGEEVASGVKVKEGEDYQFKAKLKEGEKLKHWVINEKAKSYKKDITFSYTVNKDDIDTNTNSITISFEKQ
ncbi:MAG: hypothetical protein ACTTIZ_06045 [Treponema sp.]